MNLALKQQKSESKAQRKRSTVQTTQVVDGKVEVITEEKDIIKCNKELVINYLRDL